MLTVSTAISLSVIYRLKFDVQRFYIFLHRFYSLPPFDKYRKLNTKLITHYILLILIYPIYTWFLPFSYFSLVKILIALATCVSCALFGSIAATIIESNVANRMREDIHPLFSLLLRIFLLTFSCKKWTGFI